MRTAALIKEPLEPLILAMRGNRVILDADLARLYGVPTKALNQAVKRNAARFPTDFAFQLTLAEATELRVRPPVSDLQVISAQADVLDRSQFVTGSYLHRDPRFLPWAFTEHGALMAANILHSGRAMQISVYVVRAFVRLRQQIAANAAILKRLAEIDRTLLEHDETLRALWASLRPLLQPPPEPSRGRIGFQSGKRGIT